MPFRYTLLRTVATCSCAARNQVVPRTGSLHNTRFFTSSARRQITPTKPPHFQSSSSLNQIYVRFGPNPRRTKGPSQRTLIIVTVSGVVGVVYYVSHLEQVPHTGRWRFMNTDAEEEQAIADALHKQTLREYQEKILPVNHPITRHVRRVVSRILTHSKLGVLKHKEPIRAAGLFPFGFGDMDVHGTFDTDVGASDKPAYGPDKEWDVIVVNDNKMINAMAFPGTVVVFTGILPVCQDEQGLAAVVAHEIGHIVARHTAERLSGGTISFILLAVIAALTSLDFSFLSIGNSLLRELPNSRTQEKEADLIGLRLMSRACYDPRAAPEMFERLDKVESKIASSVSLPFMRTHPTSESRVKFLEGHLGEAYDILNSNPDCENLLRQHEAFRETAKRIRADQTGSWEILS